MKAVEVTPTTTGFTTFVGRITLPALTPPAFPALNGNQARETIGGGSVMPESSPVSCRRIDHLRQFAYDCKLSADAARPFGKLTATKTWEALLNSRGLRSEPGHKT